MDNRPIGVFDSGLGGLTAVKELIRALPNEDIVYFGDTGRVPYGTRSRETIIKYALQDVAFLNSHDVKMIIIACGTVSSVAADIGGKLTIPYTGVVGPAALAAAQATRNKRVGVIGTTATIRSGCYRRELTRLDGGIEAFEKDCPLFVPLVENGFISPDDPVTRLVAECYLAGLREAGVDTLILGCTHYPILSETIRSVMGKDVTLIDTGRETALYAARYLKEQELLCDGACAGEAQYFVSDRVEGFSRIAGIFLGQCIDSRVSRVDIESF